MVTKSREKFVATELGMWVEKNIMAMTSQMGIEEKTSCYFDDNLLRSLILLLN
jgi:hypothetical protein